MRTPDELPTVTIRDLKPEDGDRVREVVDSTMTTSYRLSPQQIDAVVADQFGQGRLPDVVEDEETTVLVAESDEVTEEVVVAGVAEASRDGDAGEIRWLAVDPEHRGLGLGTELFERAADALREQGVEEVRVTVLEANTEGHQFAERFDFEHAGERDVEMGEESFVEYVYSEAASAETDRSKADEGDGETLPDTETTDGQTTTSADDGQTLYVDTDDELSGTAGRFFPAYEDEAHEEQFGYYCGNCGSMDVSVDQMDRYECSNCGNSHASRSEESYDDGHL